MNAIRTNFAWNNNNTKEAYQWKGHELLKYIWTYLTKLNTIRRYFYLFILVIMSSKLCAFYKSMVRWHYFVFISYILRTYIHVHSTPTISLIMSKQDRKKWRNKKDGCSEKKRKRYSRPWASHRWHYCQICDQFNIKKSFEHAIATCRCAYRQIYNVPCQ